MICLCSSLIAGWRPLQPEDLVFRYTEAVASCPVEEVHNLLVQQLDSRMATPRGRRLMGQKSDERIWAWPGVPYGIGTSRLKRLKHEPISSN